MGVAVLRVRLVCGSVSSTESFISIQWCHMGAFILAVEFGYVAGLGVDVYCGLGVALVTGTFHSVERNMAAYSVIEFCFISVVYTVVRPFSWLLVLPLFGFLR